MEKLIIASIFTFLHILSVDAQIFLRNDYVEIGIHSAGSFGSDSCAPMGYHANLEFLGFVCDHQKDGWSNGTPGFMGDYFVPGTPEEGWSLEWTKNNNEYIFHNYGLMWEQGVITDLQQKIVTPDEESGIWEGRAISGNDILFVAQKTTLRKDDLYFTINILLRNDGPDTLKSVEYMRNLDPDNEVVYTSSYFTNNFVRYQPGYGGNADTAMVVAVGEIYNVPVLLGAVDSRARVSVGGFSNRDPDVILDYYNMPTESLPSYEDEAISIAFRLGDMAPGQCLSFTYFYGLEEVAAGSALSAMQTNISTLGVCLGETTTLQAQSYGIGSLEASNYFWDLNNDGIFEGNGQEVTHVFPNQGLFPISILVSFCDGRTDTIIDTVEIFNSPLVNLGPDLTICDQTTTTIQSQSEGNYLWSTGSQDSTITVAASGSYTLTVSDTSGCYSTDEIAITFPPMLTLNLGTDTTLCQGETWTFEPSADNTANYTWQGITVSNPISIHQNGTYIASVSNACYSSTDTIQLRFIEEPSLSLPEDTQICSGTPILVNVGGSFCHYNGTTGINNNQLLIEGSGIYSVYAYNQCGSDEKSIQVTESLCDIIIPNIFTPNNDGINDFFSIAYLEEGDWVFTIYNRWGFKLYQGTDPANWKAEKHSSGTYYFVAQSLHGRQSKTGFVEILH